MDDSIGMPACSFVGSVNVKRRRHSAVASLFKLLYKQLPAVSALSTRMHEAECSHYLDSCASQNSLNSLTASFIVSVCFPPLAAGDAELTSEHYRLPALVRWVRRYQEPY